jgi:hypothetical protein
LRDIVAETNCYAMEEDVHGDTCGGPAWRNLTVPELKAFIAASFLMGLKKQPNNKSYLSKEGSFFHCPRISKIFTRDRFQELVRCLHLTNPTNYVREKTLPGYDKMGQVRWVVNSIRDNCRKVWNLGKFSQ